ncbi:MAG: insulinase family protein [bacterium]
MKKVFVFIILIILVALQYAKATDSTIVSKPEPLPEKEIKFPEYKEFTLDNGLKVFVFEDHRQPTISFRLLIAGGKSVDTLKPGIADITASLLTKGTKKLTALDLAKKIDGVGADISASAGTDFITVQASGLKKHLSTILDVYSQVITGPVFPDKEFEKIVPQMIAAIRQEKADPRLIASKIARKAIYGEQHPYALFASEKSIGIINISDIKNYYINNFIPNNATLAIIGDVKANDIIKEIKKKFKNWEKSNKDFTYNIPSIKSLPLGVYFVERPASVQSTIMFATKAVAYTNKDYDLLGVATNVISGGIAGRLFRTLREEYSYTYTPFGNISQNKYTGWYFCGADVKNVVTDSALKVMLKQITSLTQELTKEDELKRVKTYQSGTYKMAFESSDYIAALIQNADFYGKPIEELAAYANKIMNFSPHAIKNIASQFLNPSKGYLIIVGSPEVKEKLSQFGKLYDFDLDLNPLSGEKAKMEPISMTSNELIEKYINSIGGRDSLNNIQTVIDSAQVEMISGSNVMKGTLIQYQKSPGKKYMDFDMNVFRQQVWVDGKDVWVKLNQVEKMETDESEKFIYDAQIFKDTRLVDMGYNCSILGKQGNTILMKAVSPKGFASTYFFDAKTFHINKIERVETTGRGTLPITETIKEYVEIAGMKFPKVIESVTPLNTIITVHYYIINQPIDDNLFLPKD